MTGLEAASVYVAVNILILVWLAVRVVGNRIRERDQDSVSDELASTIRVHGNASEYIPAMLIGLVGLALLDGAVLVIHGLGITFTLARILHVIGMNGGPIQARQIGILLTWACMVIVSLAMLYHVFT